MRLRMQPGAFAHFQHFFGFSHPVLRFPILPVPHRRHSHPPASENGSRLPPLPHRLPSAPSTALPQPCYYPWSVPRPPHKHRSFSRPHPRNPHLPGPPAYLPMTARHVRHSMSFHTHTFWYLCRLSPLFRSWFLLKTPESRSMDESSGSFPQVFPRRPSLRSFLRPQTFHTDRTGFPLTAFPSHHHVLRA